MLFDLLNLSDYNLFQVFIHALIAFYLGAGQRHGVKILLIGAGKVGHICFNP